MNRRQKIIVSVTSIFLVLLLLVGLTYAYFLTKINGNENNKSISVTTANLAIVYGDGNGVITGNNIVPGTSLDEKTFTVENEGNAEAEYVVVIEDVKVTYAANINDQVAGTSTTFESNDFVYTLACTSDGKDCNGVDTETIFPIDGGILVKNSIEVGKTHTYSLIVTYKETGIDQSNDMNKKLEAKVNIADILASNSALLLMNNIINNSKNNLNGTMLVDTPETTPAVSISGATGTGEYELVTVTASMRPMGFAPWKYADTAEEAQTGSSANGKTCSDLVGKYIYDQSSIINGVVKVESCDGEDPIVNQEIMDYESVLSVTQDDLGTSYYYRGKVEDNYVDFNGMCWRIVRIEGDGAIKLVLEDKDSTCSTADGNWDIGTGHYGYNYAKVTNSSGQESTSNKYIADYLNGQTFTSTSMKSQFDAWLTSSGIDTTKLKKDTWCLGNATDPYDSSGTLLTSSISDLMYNSTSFYYDTYRRLYGVGTTANATLKCDGTNDKTFESYIGALTADEVVFAGGKVDTPNYNYYLYNLENTKSWGTLSLNKFGGSEDFVFAVVGVYGLSIYQRVSDTFGLRPSISLAISTVITGGNGTKTNPYVVE